MEVTVRAAAGAELDVAARLAASARGGAEEGWRERFAADRDAADACFLVAVQGDHEGGGAVVGYARARYFEPRADAPARTAPAGYYLTGVLVAPAHRRLGVGEQLTRARMGWAAERAEEMWYFTNAGNRASLRLHEALGFAEVTRDVVFPGVTFTGGVGVLCRAPLARLAPGRAQPGLCAESVAPAALSAHKDDRF
ncbi:MAG TPA: GNAT family N-acetyltransferase [Streptosporangiaceae bacterium]